MITAEPILLKGRTIFSQKGVDRFLDFIYAQLSIAALNLKNKMKIYPPYKEVSWKSIGGFVSDRQRKFVMWSLTKETMAQPYVRTQDLKRSWTTQGHRTTDSLEWIVGSNLGESPFRRKYVQSRDKQHRRMRIIGWQTTSDIAEKEWPKEKRRIERAIARYRP